MRSLELFWPCTILAKNLGDVLAHGLSYQDLKAFEARPQSAFRPGLKGLEGLLLLLPFFTPLHGNVSPGTPVRDRDCGDHFKVVGLKCLANTNKH